MIRRVASCAAASAALVLLSAGSAGASAGTETMTEHVRDEVAFTSEEPNPCTGEEGTLTAIAKNGKFHITTQADGQLWITGTDVGSVTFTPKEAGGVSASGRF